MLINELSRSRALQWLTKRFKSPNNTFAIAFFAMIFGLLLGGVKIGGAPVSPTRLWAGGRHPSSRRGLFRMDVPA